MAVAFVDMLGFAMIFPLLPYYAQDFGISEQGIGVIMASFSLAQLVSAPLWGRVSDRYGRRPALLIGLTASAASFVVFAFANSFWLLLASRAIQGAGGGTTGVLHAYVADTIPPDDRTRSLGWLSAATSTGTMIGPAIGSTAAFWGQVAPGLLAAGLCVVNIVFAWGWLKESSTSANRERKPVWHMAWTVVRHPSRVVSRLLIVYALGMLAFIAFTAMITLYLDQDFGIDEFQIGYVFVYVSGLSVVMRSLLLGPIVDRLGETRTMRIGAASLLLGFLTAPLAESFWTLMGLMALIPIGMSLTFPSTTALTSRYADPGELGTTMGTAQSLAGVSRTVSPLLSTSLFQQIGHTVPFYFSAACMGLVGVLSLTVPAVRPQEAVDSATSLKQVAEG
jgi:MFS family permease